MSKRNKLFLIGNGFDLAHGMKTRYEDFILDVLKNRTLKVVGLSYNWKYNKECDILFDISQKNYLNEEEQTSIRRSDSLQSFFKLIKNSVDVDGVNGFVKSILGNGKLNWIDIESEYFYELIRVFNQNEEIFLNDRSKIGPHVDALKKVNSSFSMLRTELEVYLTSVETKIGPIPDISKAIRDELEGLSDDGHALFLNFNYTSTLHLYVSDFKLKIVDVNNIHGELNSEDNPIIFGYGDEMDPYYEKMEHLNDNEFLKNMKSFSYSKTKNYQNLSRFLSSDQYDVVIMGHSCGLSDRVLLNSIFENENCKSIKIYYYQKSVDENDYFEKVLDISRHFKPESKHEMRLKIVPFVDCKPLVAFSGK